MKEYTTIKDRMKVLLDWHRIITSPHTPPVRAFACDHRHLPLGLAYRQLTQLYVWGGVQKALAELKPRVMSNIEEGRRLLGLDMIVKTPSGEPATENNTAVLKLYRMVHLLCSPLPHALFFSMSASYSTLLTL